VLFLHLHGDREAFVSRQFFVSMTLCQYHRRRGIGGFPITQILLQARGGIATMVQADRAVGVLQQTALVVPDLIARHGALLGQQ
jgi:hypothetical protein